EGMRRMLKMGVGEPIRADRVEVVRMGTTIATNALLERRGARTVLVITRGFRDALRIGNQSRPRIFDRRIAMPPAVYEQVIEASERVSADGTIIEALDEAALAVALRRAFAEGLRACAIVFLHGYRQAAHEERAAALAREAGFAQVSVSHRVSPLMKLVPRGDTTVTDAYLSPVVRRYVEELRVQMPGVRLLFMQSSGGLTDASRFHGKDAVLSGPAGGIVGMVASAQAAGYDRLIGFDMGGTSTDVSHYAGRYERILDTDIGGVRLSVPMMNIHTIAAGGGSVIRFDGARLRVGPASAGSNPGPASYRRGGPLTITDANILLGRIQVEHFPQVFGARADAPLDRDVVVRGFADLAASVAADGGVAVSAEDIAAGGVRIAVGNMVNAIKKISIARGHPVTRYTLQCFGGAGGQHACLVADALGIEKIFCHPLAGVLSAYGIGMAEQSVIRTASLERFLNRAGIAAAWSLAASLEADARAELARAGSGAAPVSLERQVHVRYAGTDTALPCRLPAPQSGERGCESIRTDFEAGYRRRFSFLMPHAELILEAVAVECMVQRTEGADASASTPAAAPAYGYVPADPVSAGAKISMYCFADGTAAGWRTGQLVHRDRMQTGALLQGPAVIVERNGTTVLEPGWQAVRSAAGNLELTRATERPTMRLGGVRADPVMLEIFNNLFMSIAEQMGLRLQSTAHSVNIKERLDFSCALFDATGSLIANAPHMPVHLGSMGESILAVIRRHPKMQAGDAFVLNDPYHGGTHLPDLTVVTPVFMTGTTPDFFVASRGHHADIGGVSPGSMPPFSTHIAEEGVLLENLK
ncbi:MAG: hydantoinase B/oxoprolinase family protein, partial [Pseudomonadota bacterium]|nr:hydantoinase B/oxoprolinase family protein [Pseudomonadota bacterium]